MPLTVLSLILNLYSLLVEFYNYLTLPRLKQTSEVEDPALLQPLSILIPVRNQARTVLTCLNSLKNLDYPVYEILVYDDNSTDNTWELLRSANVANLRIFRGLQKPAGWLGKNYALSFLSRQTQSKLLLFLDGDVVIKDPGMIKRAVNELMQNDLGMLSLMPAQRISRPSLNLFIPMVLYWLILNFMPVSLAAGSGVMPLANGQFLLFREFIYRQIGGHGAVKDAVAEDLELANLIRRRGYRYRSFFDTTGISTDMYADNKEAWNGFARNLHLLFGGNFLLQILLVLVLFLEGVLPWILLFFDPLACLSLILLFAGKALYAVNTRSSLKDSLLFLPLQIPALIALLINSKISALTGSARWKDRPV